MQRRHKRHGKGLYGKQKRQTKAPSGRWILWVMLLGFCIYVQNVDHGPLARIRDALEARLPSEADIREVVETLGQSFSIEKSEGEPSVLVFGRMILGLDTETEDEIPPPQEVCPTEQATPNGIAESVCPIVDAAQLAESSAQYELDDSTINEVFHIPSPDIVDETLYAVPTAFVLPLSEYRVTSRFGYRIHPISGNTTFHYGADLAASTGTRVVSVASGTVSETGIGNINGKYVKIAHADGYASHYTHLHTFMVKEGEAVTRGQQIGTVGSTGYSTGPHLHFELRKNGKVLDPFRYFSF